MLYTFSLNHGFASVQGNIDNLANNIITQIPTFDRLEVIGDSITAYFTEELDDNSKSLLHSIVIATDIPPSNVITFPIDKKINNMTPYKLSSFTFFGSKLIPNIKHIKIEGNVDDGITCMLSLFDYTNVKQIAMIELTNTTQQAIEMIAVSNIPAMPATFEIFGSVIGNGSCYVRSLLIYYE